METSINHQRRLETRPQNHRRSFSILELGLDRVRRARSTGERVDRSRHGSRQTLLGLAFSVVGILRHPILQFHPIGVQPPPGTTSRPQYLLVQRGRCHFGQRQCVVVVGVVPGMFERCLFHGLLFHPGRDWSDWHGR